MLAIDTIYAVNAGGPQVIASDSTVWTADTAASPSIYSNQSTSGSGTFGNNKVVNTASIAPEIPTSIFNTERYDGGGVPMQWDFPVTAGNYEVRLYFAEIYNGAHSVGGRLFNVSIEGTTVLQNFDTFAEAGPDTAIMKSFIVTSDSNLDIDFAPIVQNPAIKGIEILQVSENGTLGVSTSALNFGSVEVGESASQLITLTNLGAPGDSNITVQSTAIGGAVSFTDNFNDATDIVLSPGQSTQISVTFSPTAAGAQAATLQVSHSGVNSPVSVPLSGTGTVAPVGSSLIRINAGGPAVGSPEWSADTAASPSPLSNYAAAQSVTFTTGQTINVTDPSIPAGTPASIFSTERYDLLGGQEMKWDVPVTPGPYEVRLYFAETYGGNASVGARVFDVSIEGQLVLDNYDVFADVGSAFKGVMKSFQVFSDSNLDIDLDRVTENPSIKAIEIISLQEPNLLIVSSDTLDFGSVTTGTSATQSITLTNSGQVGDPSITLSSTTIVGSAAFTDNFNDINGAVLAPGQSIVVDVTFNPSNLVGQTATLQLQHSGTNNPLNIALSGIGTNASPIGFSKSALVGPNTVQHPTSLQWGPDDRLYVAHQNGTIYVYSIVRNAANDYVATIDSEITLIKNIPNHNDDGTLNQGITTRLVTGLFVTGTAQNPVIYAASSDPRIGGGVDGTDLNLDTNSGILSRLTWNGSQWNKVDLVRGLPRSEENHTANGLLLDPSTNTLLVTQGGNTNAGGPSNNFALLPEYALSAAILSIDLTAIDLLPNQVDIHGQVYKYDLPTLDDEDRNFNGSGSDVNLAGGIQDVFGGNDGKNQAILDPTGPVQIYAPGFRNPFDIVLTEAGHLYTIDNGANAGWGAPPIIDPGTGKATNQVSEPGVTKLDNLQFISGPGYYGGHSNPTRGNTDNTFNTSNPQSPVALVGENPIENVYSVPQTAPGALAVFGSSTNGLAEYTASNFGGAMQGDLLAASYFGGNSVSRLSPDGTGAALDLNEVLFSNIDVAPLDVTAVGDDGLFPGTIWVVDWFSNTVYVFEPNDFEGGGGDPVDPNDLDGDGYSNADEIANETNPNSAADVPPDNDLDFLSDLLDDNDDNDSLLDVDDPFAIDASNGSTTTVGVSYTWENDVENPGGILNLGFTGLMINGQDNYKDLYDPDNLTAGGAAGVLTLDMATEGDALGANNTQEQAFQFGVNVSGEVDPFTVRTRILAPFAGVTPQGDQSMGVFLGTGDQDNYVKIVVTANGGGVSSLSEIGGTVTPGTLSTFSLGSVTYIDLYLKVDPIALTVQPSYTVAQAGGTSARIDLGSPFSIPASWLNGPTAMAVGIISTSVGSAPTFSPTWDSISVISESRGLEVSPDSLAALSVEVGQSTSRQIVVSHTGAPGSAAIVLDGTTILGTNAAAFSDSFNDAGSITLQPGASTIINVTFSPTTPGSKTATLRLTGIGGGTLLDIPLAGFANNPATTSRASFTINTGGAINGSTFTPGSFVIENLSTGGQEIAQIRLDLSTAILPDMVFDPFGTAGDTTAKNLQANSSGTVVGLGTHQFGGPHDTGFDVLVVPFTDFDPGETFSFSIDVDPTSIKGTPSPGPNQSGSVSGLELVGSTVTIVFSDGSTQTAQLFRQGTSLGASRNILRSETTSQLSVALLGVPYSPTSVLSNVNQTVRVTGPVGANISLLDLESGLFTEGLPGGGFDIDPFESNSALGAASFSATIGAGGFVDIPVTLRDTNVNGGLNTLVAVIQEADGHTGPLSPPLIVQVGTTSNTTPTVVSPLGSIVATVNDPNTVINLATVFSDVEDGTNLTYTVQSNSNPTLVNASIVSSTLTLDYLGTQVGSASIVVRATDSGGLFVENTVTVTVNPVANNQVKIESGFVASVSSNAWTTVNLSNNYTSMVVVATPNYNGQSAPLVTRIQNATGSSFDVMIQRADNSTAVTTADVYFFVVEEGIYTVAEHGVKLEAVKYNSTVTDRAGSWGGQARSYSNSYTSPVVLGQVMTHNNTAFSTFWSKANAAGSAPTPTVLFTGKHVGEDTTSRVAETVGYVVFEAGSWNVGNTEFTVGLGANSAQGVTHAAPAVYGISGPTNPTAAVLSQSGMNGGHGSWALLNGANPFSSTSINVSVDEDQIADSERFHIAEEVAYIIFGGSFSPDGGGDPDPLVPSGISAPGVYDPENALFMLRSEQSAGPADFATFNYGLSGWTPIVGDWDGNGLETVGQYNPQTATFFLNNEFGGDNDIPAFNFGLPGWTPIAGDWNGDGTDTIGVFNPDTATFFLRNSNDGGVGDVTITYGVPGWIPVTGDWDGDGTDTIGVFDPAVAAWYLRNSNTPGDVDIPVFAFGGSGWTSLVGDWDFNGTDTVGIWDPQTVSFYLRNSNSAGAPDVTPFIYGATGYVPIIGNWGSGPQTIAAKASSGTPSAIPAELYFAAVADDDQSKDDTTPSKTPAESIDPLAIPAIDDEALAESIATFLQFNSSSEEATDEALKSLFG